jgi:hypothetical protein
VHVAKSGRGGKQFVQFIRFNAAKGKRLGWLEQFSLKTFFQCLPHQPVHIGST